jgi:DNA (cytosine-5)-methyltransferase 1
MDKNNVDTAKELPTVISFCSGYGGIERGLDLAGVEHRVLAYVEIEAFAIANLVAQDGKRTQYLPRLSYTDLKTFPAHLFRDCVDIITGGYPCQPFSAAGKRLGTEDPRHLWPFIRQHIQTIRPVRCMFENVEGHISLGLREVIGDLEGAGYNATWGIFSAAEVGAPHQRKRVYILGSDTNCRDGSAQQERKYKSPKELDECSDWGLAASDSSDVANAGGKRFSEANKWQYQQQRGAKTVGAGKNVADPKSQRGREIQSHGGGGAERGGEREGGGSIHSGEGHACRDFPDTGSEGLQGFWAECGLPKSGSKEQVGGGGDDKSTRLPSPTEWEPEPGLGRVVDGCADRVDRIRLLGNGVVPQTAARAWEILSSRLQIN